MAVMERLFERYQRQKERLDMLVKLIVAFGDAEKQVGERLLKLVGKDVGQRAGCGGSESDVDFAETMSLDFGSMWEDALEGGAWFGWEE